MGEYLSLSWLDNFVYERNEKGDLQNNKEDMEASEPAEQYMSQIDPDIFSNVDVHNRRSFIEHNSSSPLSLRPETANVNRAEKPSFISQTTGQPKCVKIKASNK